MTDPQVFKSKLNAQVIDNAIISTQTQKRFYGMVVKKNAKHKSQQERDSFVTDFHWLHCLSNDQGNQPRSNVHTLFGCLLTESVFMRFKILD
jgi:hypothetical protein